MICGVALAGLAAGGQATAQDASTTGAASSSTSSDASSSASSSAAPDVTEVTVVGSRIRKDTYNSASPIEVITRKETTALGMISTAEVLQSTSVTGGSSQINQSYGNYLVNGGAGVSTVGLRGLGPGRTLVLINGKRVSPAGSGGTVGSADLNTLPNALIGRVEVLRDGASAIYGSDAIGGVINIVTRKVDGLSMEVQGNLPEHSGGAQSRISITGGKTTGNFNIQGSVEVYDSTALKLKDRDWSKCQIDYYRDPTTGDLEDDIDVATGQPKCFPIDGGNNAGVTINTLGTATLTGGAAAAGAVGTTFNRWRPNASAGGALPGYEGVGGGANGLNVRDTYNQDLLNEDILSPVRNYTGFLQMSYQLPDFANSEIYSEVLYSKRRSQQSGFRQLSLDYPDAPGTYAYDTLVPAEIKAISGDLAGAGASDLFDQPIKARAFIGAGILINKQDVNFTKATIGLRGDFLPAYLHDWQYDAYFTYATSQANYDSQQFYIDRIHASLFNCPAGSPAGCVSAPALTPDTVSGKLPADCLNYILQDTQATTNYDEATVAFNVNGPLFKLPAGDVEAAFGVEHRYAKIDDEPDPNSISSNLLNYQSSQPTIGHTGVNEAYGEIDVPILKNLPAANELSLELAGRYTEDSKSGSADTYKAGLVWKPFSWLTLRGSQGTSFRAPALFELFQGAQSGYLTFTDDPCNDLATQTHASPNRVKNCALEVPADFEQKNAVEDVSVGGAENHLKPETSVNNTYGFVFRPTFLPSYLGKFDLAVDYFDIQISNGIAQVGGKNLLDLCYDSAAGRAGGSYCNYSSRDPADNSLIVQDGYVNVSDQGVKGYDYDLRWTQRFGDLTARIDGQATHFTSQTYRLLPTDPVTQSNGWVGSPAWSGSVNAQLTYHKWSANYGMEWVGAMDSSDYEEVDRNTDPYVFWTKDYFIHTVSVEYDADSWTILAGVRNLTDQNPPQVSTYLQRIGNAPLYSGYDLIGRQFYFDLTKKF